MARNRRKGPVKKGVWIGCGLAALVGLLACGGFIVLLFSMTQPVVDGANDFLSLLAQDKTPEAYASAAGVLRAQGDEASFTAAVKQLGLTDYISASWTSRKIENQAGSVEGTVTTKGGTAPAKVDLVYEQGKWRVVGLQFAGRDLADLISSHVLTEEELRRLAKELPGLNPGDAGHGDLPGPDKGSQPPGKPQGDGQPPGAAGSPR